MELEAKNAIEKWERMFSTLDVISRQLEAVDDKQKQMVETGRRLATLTLGRMAERRDGVDHKGCKMHTNSQEVTRGQQPWEVLVNPIGQIYDDPKDVELVEEKEEKEEIAEKLERVHVSAGINMDASYKFGVDVDGPEFGSGEEMDWNKPNFQRKDELLPVWDTEKEDSESDNDVEWWTHELVAEVGEDEVQTVADEEEEKHVFTLVLDLNETLAYSQWQQERGWRTFKRPGVDAFVEQMARFFEVVFSDQPPMYVDPVIDRLDTKGYIRYRLSRPTTKYMDGKHFQDLSKLNRNPEQVTYISAQCYDTCLQPENCVRIKPWRLENDDNQLVDLIPFLEFVAMARPSDTIEVLASYQGCDVVKGEGMRANFDSVGRTSMFGYDWLQESILMTYTWAEACLQFCYSSQSIHADEILQLDHSDKPIIVLWDQTEIPQAKVKARSRGLPCDFSAASSRCNHGADYVSTCESPVQNNYLTDDRAQGYTISGAFDGSVLMGQKEVDLYYDTKVANAVVPQVVLANVGAIHVEIRLYRFSMLLINKKM